MLRHVFVGDQERVFVIRQGRLEDIFGPGDYWLMGLGLELEHHDVGNRALVSRWTDFLIQERWELMSRHFIPVETNDCEVAVVYFGDKVSCVVGPARRVLFWRDSVEVTYDLIDAIANPQVPAFLVPAIAHLGRESQATFAILPEGSRGVLYVNGRFARQLAPGSYGFWNVAGAPRVEAALDLALYAHSGKC